jgi:hypothetical protein
MMIIPSLLFSVASSTSLAVVPDPDCKDLATLNNWQKAWCCTKQNICPTMTTTPHDCDTKDVWSAEKKLWCCKHEGVCFTCESCLKAGRAWGKMEGGKMGCEHSFCVSDDDSCLRGKDNVEKCHTNTPVTPNPTCASCLGGPNNKNKKWLNNKSCVDTCPIGASCIENVDKCPLSHHTLATDCQDCTKSGFAWQDGVCKEHCEKKDGASPSLCFYQSEVAHEIGQSCPAPHDCRTRDVWSAEKKLWCCENKKLGCFTCASCLEADRAWNNEGCKHPFCDSNDTSCLHGNHEDVVKKCPSPCASCLNAGKNWNKKGCVDVCHSMDATCLRGNHDDVDKCPLSNHTDAENCHDCTKSWFAWQNGECKEHCEGKDGASPCFYQSKFILGRGQSCPVKKLNGKISCKAASPNKVCAPKKNKTWSKSYDNACKAFRAGETVILDKECDDSLYVVTCASCLYAGKKWNVKGCVDVCHGNDTSCLHGTDELKDCPILHHTLAEKCKDCTGSWFAWQDGVCKEQCEGNDVASPCFYQTNLLFGREQRCPVKKPNGNISCNAASTNKVCAPKKNKTKKTKPWSKSYDNACKAFKAGETVILDKECDDSLYVEMLTTHGGDATPVTPNLCGNSCTDNQVCKHVIDGSLEHHRSLSWVGWKCVDAPSSRILRNGRSLRNGRRTV